MLQFNHFALRQSPVKFGEWRWEYGSNFSGNIDDYGFLWFEDETVILGSASWVVASNAAEAIVKESE